MLLEFPNPALSYPAFSFPLVYQVEGAAMYNGQELLDFLTVKVSDSVSE